MKAYIRRTINSDEAAIVENEKIWGNGDACDKQPSSEMRVHKGSAFAHKYERNHDLGSVTSQIIVGTEEAPNTVRT